VLITIYHYFYYSFLPSLPAYILFSVIGISVFAAFSCQKNWNWWWLPALCSEGGPRKIPLQICALTPPPPSVAIYPRQLSWGISARFIYLWLVYFVVYLIKVQASLCCKQYENTQAFLFSSRKYKNHESKLPKLSKIIKKERYSSLLPMTSTVNKEYLHVVNSIF
jgi:hypothetical protein